MFRSWDRTHSIIIATPTLYLLELTMKNEGGYLIILDNQYNILKYSHLQCMIGVHM